MSVHVFGDRLAAILLADVVNSQKTDVVNSQKTVSNTVNGGARRLLNSVVLIGVGS
uniref:Uncharacterized protein n=1 Tax=Physcomitrium patens TaxID=3218 RepID=A0A2K1ICZ3_PHYPA|nr:hypothetical protein PHYPA_030630 [Physcomitrium patens]